jgi:hypothetical protein
MRPLFAFAGFLAACGAGAMDSSPAMTAQDYMPPIPAGARTEAFRRIALQPDGASAGLSISGIHAQRRQVIQDAATWTAAWHEIFAGRMPEPDLAPVDFSKETVLLAAMGDCMNGGYSIAIDSVFAGADGGATAGVSSVTPDPMCMMMQMQVVTQPVDVVAVPKASAVAFAERGSMSMCGGMPMMGMGH